MNKFILITKGIIKENPVFRLLLGLCPTLAVTTEARNGLGMGLATAAVLLCSNIVIASFKNFIPNKVRIPVFIVVIATFVTIVEMLLHAYFFQLYKVLGLFIPLIVVNCIILGRAEAFASKNTIIDSILDAIGMGLGFTLSLILLGAVREILGNGTCFGFTLFGDGYVPFIIMILPPGAFIALGIMLAIINKVQGAHS
ncbi:MAG: electron transport complex subunit E [Candidatus Omnitrophica bacterium]|nr:electron transport complex subunit E [Candidatus Omnitrophota bacterium]